MALLEPLMQMPRIVKLNLAQNALSVPSLRLRITLLHISVTTLKKGIGNNLDNLI